MDSSSARRGSKKHMVTAHQPGLKSRLDAGFQIGDLVILIAGTLASNAETALQGKSGEVIERRDDGRITVRFDHGRLIMGGEAASFERASSQVLKPKK
jgi:hypothetical protein